MVKKVLRGKALYICEYMYLYKRYTCIYICSVNMCVNGRACDCIHILFSMCNKDPSKM